MKKCKSNKFVILAEHDGMSFVFIRGALKHNNAKGDYIGYYTDRLGYYQSVFRGSVYAALAEKYLSNP